MKDQGLNEAEIIKLIADEAVSKHFEWFSGEPLDFKSLRESECLELVDNDLDIFFICSNYDIAKYLDFLNENRTDICKLIVEQLKSLWA